MGNRIATHTPLAPNQLQKDALEKAMDGAASIASWCALLVSFSVPRRNHASSKLNHNAAPASACHIPQIALCGHSGVGTGRVHYLRFQLKQPGQGGANERQSTGRGSGGHHCAPIMIKCACCARIQRPAKAGQRT